MEYSSPAYDLNLLDKVTAFSDAGTVRNAHYLIDCEIQRMNSYISSLKTRWNSLVLVSRLPPEILSDIFLILAETLQINRFETSFKWLPVSHVCRLWRGVALNHGRLWDRVYPYNQALAAEFFVRSKAAPLSLRLSVEESSINSPSLILSTESRCFREFHLQVTGRIGPDVLQLISCPSHASVIESLILDVSDNTSQLLLPTTGFGDHASRLNRLQLHNVRLQQWPSTFFPSLTHLAIHHSGNNFSPKPTLSVLLAALANMPCLEALHLVDQSILDFSGTSITSDITTVNLPLLSVLNLFGTVSDCIALTSHISFPAFVDLELHCTDVNDISQIEHLLRFVKANFNLLLGRDASFLRVNIDSTSQEFILTCEKCPSGTKPLVSVGFYTRTREFLRTQNAEICVAVFMAIPHTPVKIIRIRNQFQMAYLTWARILGSTTEVRVLDVFFNCAINLPSVIGSKVTSSDFGDMLLDNAQFYCPKLRVLTFHGVSFHRRTSLSLRFSDALLDCLDKRFRSGARVKALAFNSCGDVGHHAAIQFRSLVERVYWDEDPPGGLSDSE